MTGFDRSFSLQASGQGWRTRLGLALATLFFALPAKADDVAVRQGTHGRSGRVVFDFPQPQAFTFSREGDALVLNFPDSGAVPSSPGQARNVSAVEGGNGGARILLRPKTQVRVQQFDHRVVVDLFDPPPRRIALPAPSAGSRQPLLAEPAVQPAAPKGAQPNAPIPSVSPENVPGPAKPEQIGSAAPNPATPPVEQGSSPASPVLQTQQIVSGSGSLLPFSAGVGCAAFRHGDEVWLVFDERRPIDLSGAPDGSLLNGAEVTLLPMATLVRLTRPVPAGLRLTRQPGGWRIAPAKDADMSSATPGVRDDGLFFPMPASGHVVAVPDPDSGRNLLVGTLLQQGPRVAAGLRWPELAVAPSLQGLVVEPASDRLEVRPVQGGFAVIGLSAVPAMPSGGEPDPAALALTHSVDIPNGSAQSLMNRLQAAQQDQAAAPPQARLQPRKQAAAAMLALGMGAEAQSLLRLAATEDPRASADAEFNVLSGIAALLAERPGEASGLDAGDLPSSDELMLWRAYRAAVADPASGQAAVDFAATVPLVSTYPAALQARLLPVAAEAMVKGGAAEAADKLLSARPGDNALDYARALRAEQKGDHATALSLLDGLAKSRDRLTRAKAIGDAALLRRASGQWNDEQTADALASSFDSWRGDQRELDLRLKAVELWQNAGQWRRASDLLHETSTLFPDSPEIKESKAKLVQAFISAPPQSIDPLDFVTLTGAFATDLSPDQLDSLASSLTDKLIALDLPDRAGPLIQHMVDRLSEGRRRAELGVKLAQLKLHEGDVAGAVAALTTTEAAGLPDALVNQRAVVLAAAKAQAGDRDGALALLQPLATTEAIELRAKIFGEQGNWGAAAEALGQVATGVIPEQGALQEKQQEFVIELGAALARAGRRDQLHALMEAQTPRLTEARQQILRFLAVDPVRGSADLDRARHEISLAREIPTALAALHTQ